MSIAERLAEVNRRLTQAATEAGRDPSEVHLVAVSKTKPASMIREAYAAGQRDFGENYAQELRDKTRELADLPDIRWHFIGRLQANKAKYVAPVAYRVHAIDDVETAKSLLAKRDATAGPLTVLVAVNLGGEAQKSGVPPDAVLPLATALQAAGVVVAGLMTLPPDVEDPEAVAPYFEALAGLAERGREAGLPLRELSMGMSHDAHIAVRYGAGYPLWVRVGTAIFGERA